MRNRPVFQPPASPNPDPNPGPGGCLWALIGTVGSYFVLMAINRVLAGEASNSDKRVCYGALAGLVILVILALRQERREQAQRRAAKQAWKQTSQSAEVAIVERRYSPRGDWEDEYGIPHSSRASYRLELAPTAEQQALHPGLRIVNVEVNADIYTKLLDRNAVRIFYQPEAPMMFSLEEELDENQ